MKILIVKIKIKIKQSYHVNSILYSIFYRNYINVYALFSRFSFYSQPVKAIRLE